MPSHLSARAVVESDVRAAALAEAHFGAGRGVQELLFVIVGTGISCCLVLGGHTYAGARGNAICFGAPPLEQAASGLALAAAGGRERAEEVLADARLDSVVEAAARELGVGLAWLVNALDPATVVIGGGLGLVDRYRELAVEAMRPLIFADNTRGLPVVPAELGMDAGVIGAALAAVRAQPSEKRRTERARRLGCVDRLAVGGRALRVGPPDLRRPGSRSDRSLPTEITVGERDPGLRGAAVRLFGKASACPSEPDGSPARCTHAQLIHAHSARTSRQSARRWSRSLRRSAPVSLELVTVGRVSVDLYAREQGVGFAEVETFAKSIGGSPTNVAVAAARLGRRAAVITAVGDDPLGEYVRGALAGRFGVDVRFVGTHPTLRTPLAFAAMDPPEDPQLLFYREPAAPDMQIELDTIDRDAVREAAILWISASALSAEPSRGTALALMRDRERATTILDLDYRADLLALRGRGERGDRRRAAARRHGGRQSRGVQSGGGDGRSGARGRRADRAGLPARAS